MMTESNISEEKETAHPFVFEAKYGKLFGIYVENLFLTLATLGLYHFWASVNVTRYLYRNTLFQNEPFDYHATGRERLQGFLWGFALVLIFLVLFKLFFHFLTEQVPLIHDYPKIASTLLVYLIFLTVYPFVRMGQERYQLSRTSWRNIRFSFRGKTWQITKEILLGSLLTLLTVGLYAPRFAVRLIRFFRENSSYGDGAFRFDGRSMNYFTINATGLLFTLLTFGFYIPWWIARIFRYKWNHTTFQNCRFHTDLSGIELMVVFSVSTMLVILTLGLAMPVSVILMKRIYIESLELRGEPDLTVVQANPDRGANSFFLGLKEAGGIFDTLTGIFRI